MVKYVITRTTIVLAIKPAYKATEGNDENQSLIYWEIVSPL